MNTQEMTMNNETDLDWLARNVHVWPEGKNFICYSRDHGYEIFHEHDKNCAEWFTKEQLIARQSDMRNKPKFIDHPDAKCFFQHESGEWFKNVESPDMGIDGIGWRNNQLSRRADSGWVSVCKGLVIGDWRDTLEKRPYISAANCTVTSPGSFGVTVGVPADLFGQAVTARLQEATDNVLAAVPELKSDRFKFDPFTSVEDNQEQDMQQDNGWFERGGLPPVGAVCLYVVSDRISAEVEITAHAKFGICFVQVGRSGESYVSKTAELHRFRPIRTEREVLISVIIDEMNRYDTDAKLADAILAAGFKLEKK